MKRSISWTAAALLLPAAIAPANAARPCVIASELAAAGIVVRQPAESTKDSEYELEGRDLSPVQTLVVSWPDWCTVTTVVTAPENLISANGGSVFIEDFGSSARLVPVAQAPSPPPSETGPLVPGYRIIASIPLHVPNDSRIGLWRNRQEMALIAAFRPGTPGIRPLLRSGAPIVALDYLPAPDAAGGTLALLQRPRSGQARLMYFRYSERGLYPPARQP